jgi:hypothetical protein
VSRRGGKYQIWIASVAAFLYALSAFLSHGLNGGAGDVLTSQTDPRARMLAFPAPVFIQVTSPALAVPPVIRIAGSDMKVGVP